MSTKKQDKPSTGGTGSGNVRSGEAGHQGQDRQPSNDVKKSAGRAPDASEAAQPIEVAARSKEASAVQHTTSQTGDIAHPGPERLEAERSKGDTHHDGNERERDMQKKVEGL